MQTKRDLIERLMKEYGKQYNELTVKSKEELEADLYELDNEFSDGYNPLFPNGRDFDAEDEDGI